VSTEYGRALAVADLESLELRASKLDVYDAAIGVHLLYEDPGTGAEHYLIRYPAGLGARPHRHTAAHTVVLLEGRLRVNDEVIAAHGYCHFPAGETMTTARATTVRACSSSCSTGPSTSNLLGPSPPRPNSATSRQGR
jgi:hypothetical protein